MNLYSELESVTCNINVKSEILWIDMLKMLTKVTKEKGHIFSSEHQKKKKKKP